MIIHWLEDAIDDLKALRQYVAQDNPTAANDIAKRLIKSVNLLAEQPGMGKAGRVPYTRELVISNLPYIIPYQVINNEIIILRVMHGAMEWPTTFKEKSKTNAPVLLI